MVRSLLAAVSLITRCPLGKFLPTERELQSCSNYFPVVGLLLGVLLYWPSYYAIAWFSPSAGGFLVLLMLEAVSGGFHLDGLADTADAFLSSRTRERKLEIMHDSHIGTMGVAAIVLVLLGKYSVLSMLPPWQVGASVLFCAFIGRFGITCYLLISRYARPNGLGKILYDRRPYGGVLVGLVLGLGASLCFFGFDFLWILLPSLLFVVLWDRVCRMQIGGATGDTIGACEQLLELLVCFEMLYFFS